MGTLGDMSTQPPAGERFASFDPKFEPLTRDVFDASVFACVRILESLERSRKAQKWLEEP